MDRKCGAAARVTAIVSAVALTGCGAGSHRAHTQPGPLVVAAHPEVSGATTRTRAPARPEATTRTRPARPNGGTRTRATPSPPAPWLINPDEPLPRNSRWWPVLAVARRFAVADMSYEIGELGPAVRRTIMATCTGAFAGGLFAHRPSLPPGVSPRQVSQRVFGVQPLARVRGAAVVLATVRSNRRGGAPGSFELRLVPRSGGWRVAGLSVV